MKNFRLVVAGAVAAGLIVIALPFAIAQQGPCLLYTSFASRWPETLGEPTMAEWKRTNALKVFHYSEGREVELGYQLVEDARQYEAYPDVGQPVLIFHGRNDTVVPPEYSVSFAERHPAERHPNVRLRLLDSDHELGNVLDTMWIETEELSLIHI